MIVDLDGEVYGINEYAATVGMHRVGGKPKRVVRVGGVPFDDGHIRWYCLPTDRVQDLHAYIVFITKATKKRWRSQRDSFICIARSIDAAKNALNKEFAKIIAKSAGLAKRTLGVGMSKVATQSGTGRVAAGSAKTARVRRASNKYSDAKVWINGEEYGVRMDSNLCYALDAVRGGSPAIDRAVRKAMNAVAGYINYALGGTLDPRNRRFLTPFRDLVGK